MLDPQRAREIGLSLRRIRDDVVAQPTAGLRREWYQGNGDFFDLFLDRNADSGVGWLQMSRGGRYIECDFAKQFFVTGITGDRKPREVAHPHSQELLPDPLPDIGLLDDLIRILGSRSNEVAFEGLTNQLREFRASIQSNDSE